MKTDFMEHEMNCKELKKHVIFVISMFFFVIATLKNKL